ncbi:hypothetical protein [Geobacter sp. OR-1]|uniref:hypothetical protein n=1 Tax=Geobacter sp. OR-1 TaxID=1266765 RepID=UPI001269C77A|nr:hypothetical protein [Geobacter sp. OR-1]
MSALLVLPLSGCATVRPLSELYPPIMDQDELSRPYVKIAVIECSSERMGNMEAISRQDYDWAHNELRERAYRLGADAVVLPEVRIERDTFLFFPSSLIKVKGVAIKFR